MQSAPSQRNCTGFAVAGAMLLTWACGGGESPESPGSRGD